MKKLILIICVLTLVGIKKSFAQLPSVVFDPQGLSQAVQNGTMLQTLVSENTQIVEMHEAYKNLRKATNWVQKLRSVKMAIDLLENTVCTSQDLEIKMQRAGVIDNCMFQFEYYNALMGLASATDILNLILSDMDQTPESRVSNSNEAMEIMAESHRKLMDLQERSQKILDAQQAERQYKKDVYEFVSLKYDR